MIEFQIEQWRAWAPGMNSPQNWHDWAHAPQTITESAEQPECLALPPMQRRRLSRLARMTMEVASPLCAEGEQLPFVFGSRHGETTRTLALLHDVAGEQPLSPTHFGLSVHNAIAGQWSLLRGQRGESVAIAGEGDTFEHVIVEAAALLGAGAPAVLAVMAEEVPPSAYDGWVNDVPFSYAVALRLSRVDTGDAAAAAPRWTLKLDRNEGADAKASEWPQALDFLRVMLSARNSLEHVWKKRRWQWQRQS